MAYQAARFVSAPLVADRTDSPPGGFAAPLPT
jgi:hypothetical protein